MNVRKVNPFWRKSYRIMTHYFEVCYKRTGCNGCPLCEEKTGLCLATGGSDTPLEQFSERDYRKHIEQVLRTAERFDEEGEL